MGQITKVAANVFSLRVSENVAGWIARTEDIRATAAAASHSLGTIESMTRGLLGWLITIPADGSLPLEGIAPMLIQWRQRPHPASQLPDKGCSLVRLEAFHPFPDMIQTLLRSIGFQDEFVVSMPQPGQGPHLVAHVQTPSGLRRLIFPE